MRQFRVSSFKFRAILLWVCLLCGLSWAQFKDTTPGQAGLSQANTFTGAQTFTGAVNLNSTISVGGAFVGGIPFFEGSAPTGISGYDVCGGNSTTHTLQCSFNNGTTGNLAVLNLAQSWTAIQTFSSTALTGKTTSYNNIATAGIGVIPVYGTPATLTAQSANITPTNLYASAPAGVYRVCYYYMTTTAGNAVTINIVLNWNDGTQGQSASG